MIRSTASSLTVNLHASDGAHRYHAHITSFAADHPAFGAWHQDPNGVSDPRRVHFSHQAHLRLASKLKGKAILYPNR